MNYQTIEQELAELPLYIYAWVDPQSLEFSDRVRHICQTECAMYGKSWACPPGVGTVAECRAKCLSYNKALLISSLTEVADIADLEATLATRRDHERLTDQVGDILRAHGLDPYILSTEACAICGRCAILDGKPCRHPEKCIPVWKARASTSFLRWRRTDWSSSTGRMWSPGCRCCCLKRKRRNECKTKNIPAEFCGESSGEGKYG